MVHQTVFPNRDDNVPGNTVCLLGTVYRGSSGLVEPSRVGDAATGVHDTEDIESGFTAVGDQFVCDDGVATVLGMVDWAVGVSGDCGADDGGGGNEQDGKSNKGG